MTTIQQVLFELETDYMGHPYYLTGHALYTALARRVDAQARRSLNVSTGVFVPWRVRGIPGVTFARRVWREAWHVAPTSGVVRGCVRVSGCSAAVVAGLTATGCAQHARRPESWRPTGVCTEGSLRPAARASEQQADDALARPLLPARRWGDEDVLPLSVDVLDGLRVGGVETTGSVNYRSRRRRSLIWMTSITRGFEKQTTSSWNCCRRTCCRAIRRGLTVSRCRGGGSLTGSFVAGRVGSWPVMSVMSWQ